MKYLIITFLSLSSIAVSEKLSEISEVLKYVESSNNPKAIGDGGAAYGVLQIHKGAILDVNQYYGTEYTHQDAFNEACAEEIFELYISMGIDRYRKRYGQFPPEKRLVQMWNFGIYQRPYDNGYYKKYLQWKARLNLR